MKRNTEAYESSIVVTLCFKLNATFAYEVSSYLRGSELGTVGDVRCNVTETVQEGRREEGADVIAAGVL